MLAAPLPRRCLSYEKKNWAFFLFFSLQARKAFFLGPLSATQALPKLLAATSSFTQIPVVSASPSNAQARFIFDLFVIGEREKIVLWLGHPNFITHPTMIGSRQNSLHLNCITTADKWVCKPTVKLLFLFISVWRPPMFMSRREYPMRWMFLNWTLQTLLLLGIRFFTQLSFDANANETLIWRRGSDFGCCSCRSQRKERRRRHRILQKSGMIICPLNTERTLKKVDIHKRYSYYSLSFRSNWKGGI